MILAVPVVRSANCFSFTKVKINVESMCASPSLPRKGNVISKNAEIGVSGKNVSRAVGIGEVPMD